MIDAEDEELAHAGLGLAMGEVRSMLGQIRCRAIGGDGTAIGLSGNLVNSIEDIW